MDDLNSMLIEQDDQENTQGDPVPFGWDSESSAVADAKREALHKIVCALYAARRKNMDLGHVLQAIRDYRAEDIDDIPLAISDFDASFWGLNG